MYEYDTKSDRIKNIVFIILVAAVAAALIIVAVVVEYRNHKIPMEQHIENVAAELEMTEGFHHYNTVMEKDYLSALTLLYDRDDVEIINVSVDTNSHNVTHYHITYRNTAS